MIVRRTAVECINPWVAFFVEGWAILVIDVDDTVRDSELLRARNDILARFVSPGPPHFTASNSAQTTLVSREHKRR